MARLPKGVGPKDLWKIEAKLQFGRDFRLQYGPVNELLKIRAGKESGLSEKQISEALMGRYSPTKVGERLEVLKLIDSYLDGIGKPGGYTSIQEERIVEMFNSLHNSVVGPLRKTAEKLEVPRITEIGFEMIKSGEYSHWDVRKLRAITELPQARKTLYKLFNKKGDLDSTPGEVKDAFDKAVIIVDAQKERERPEKLADEALAVLREIDSNHASIRTPKFQNLIRQIGAEVKRLTKAQAPER